MNQETLTALQDSIAHWDRLASGNRNPNEYLGSEHCALCRMFWHDVDYNKKCDGCPVFERTERRFCEDTPYVAALEHLEESGDEALDSEEFKEAARLELEFLRSLLPQSTEQQNIESK